MKQARIVLDRDYIISPIDPRIYGSFIELEIDLRSFGDLRFKEHILLHHDDVKAVNTEENPMNVSPAAGPAAKMDGGRARICVPALSWNVIRFI